MKTKSEFVEKLNREIKIMISEFEEQDGDDLEKVGMFSEYRKLIETFFSLVKESDYEVMECICSLTALESVCQARLNKVTAVLDIDCIGDEDENDDCHETIDSVKEKLNNMRAACIAISISFRIFKLTNNVVRPSKSELEIMLDKISKLDEEKMQMVFKEKATDLDTYDSELGCTKKDAILLEKLMGEFREFDSLLRK